MLTVPLPIYDSLVVPDRGTSVWGVEIKEVALLFDSEFYELWQAWLNFESSLATAPYKQSTGDFVMVGCDGQDQMQVRSYMVIDDRV